MERTEINAWGVMRVLHTFTGIRTGDWNNRGDWALSMDPVAAGLIVMCAWFVFGLRWVA